MSWGTPTGTGQEELQNRNGCLKTTPSTAAENKEIPITNSEVVMISTCWTRAERESAVKIDELDAHVWKCCCNYPKENVDTKLWEKTQLYIS